MENLYLGKCLKKDDKLVLVQSYGYKTDVDDVEPSKGSIDYLINGEPYTSFKRAEITIDVLMDIGFKRDRSNSDYILKTKGRIIIISFETDVNLDNGLIFTYKNRRGELIRCSYIDELQCFHKDEFGEALDLSNLFAKVSPHE